MSDIKIQWHPAFIAAMNLELSQNRDDLVFEKEYNLNTKPLEIDLLVIKKDISIASLYKAYGETVDSIKADDITVSIIREVRPEKLFKYFQEHEYVVTNPYKGIYYIEGKVLFLTQIVVTRELDSNTHRWIKALSGQLNKDDLFELLGDRGRMREKADKEFADSVLEVSIEANREIVEELRKGDASMNAVLMEMMRPELQASEKAGRIRGAVETLKELGFGDDEIETKIMKSYNIDVEEASKYLQE